jgi:hypothetical protein
VLGGFFAMLELSLMCVFYCPFPLLYLYTMLKTSFTDTSDRYLDRSIDVLVPVSCSLAARVSCRGAEGSFVDSPTVDSFKCLHFFGRYRSNRTILTCGEPFLTVLHCGECFRGNSLPGSICKILVRRQPIASLTLLSGPKTT